jgi:hypothetical protein
MPTPAEIKRPTATPGSVAPSAEPAKKATIPVIYLGKDYKEPLPLSYAEPIITDKGIQGARLMLKEA